MKKLFRVVTALVALTLALNFLVGCSLRSPKKAPEAKGAISEKRSLSSSLSPLAPHETRAVELYNRWAATREQLGSHLMKDGNLKLMLTKEQAEGDFAKGFDGVLPTTKEGVKVFEKQFDKAHAAAEQMRLEAAKVIEEVRQQPVEVREVFWSLMMIHGIQQPVISRDGFKVFFQHSIYAADVSLFDKDTFLLDPADHNRLDDIYCWDLKEGLIVSASGSPM